MSQSTLVRVLQYAIAVAVTLAAVLLTTATPLGTGAPFILLLVAVLISTWLGGQGPGLVSAALAGIAGLDIVEQPLGSLTLSTPENVVRFASFAVSALVVLVIAAERDRAQHTAAMQARREAALAELGQRALTSSITQLRSQVPSLIFGILGVEYNYIARRETEAEDFLVIAGAGWKEGTIGQTRLAGSDYSEAAYALETRKPVISTNLAADKRFTPSPLLLEHCVMTAIVVPVLESDRPLGVVGAFSTHRRTVTQDDVRFLESLANTLASALQRERAYEALRVLNAELEQRVSERTAELQAAKVELEKRAAELESANVNLESFSYSVSHDLRTPLGTIHSLARSLLEGDTAGMPPLAHQSLTVITESAASMDRLIQSLLSLSRTTRQPLKKQEVRPDEMAREVVEELKPQVAGRHVEVAIDNMPACNADPILLKQVWSNLLSNAIKFTRSRETAHIEIGCAPCDGQERVYYVRDNGVGFSMAQADRLFGVFQRLHSEDEYEGTGIGLTIVERIVKRHGGRIWAESEEDKGATFHFTLGT